MRMRVVFFLTSFVCRRYTHFSRAFIASVAACVFDISAHFTQPPVSPWEVYKQGLNSPTGQSFAAWMQGLMMTGPAAASFQALMFSATFLGGSPVRPCICLVCFCCLRG